MAKKKLEKALDAFVRNNNLKKEIAEDGKIVLSNAWGDNSFELVFNATMDFSKLRKIILPTNLYALYCKDKYEFIFQPLDRKYRCIGREFNFFYDGKKYRAYYESPSTEFNLIVKAFTPKTAALDDTINYRNLKPFFEYYNLETLPEKQKESYRDLLPINFFIEGPINDMTDEERILMLNHVNFYMTYFDRETPWIRLESKKWEAESYVTPCLFEQLKDFPSEINFSKVSADLLDLLSTARCATTSRLMYIYYFQVLEYAAYYYVEEDFRRKISNILRSPDLLTKTDKYSRILIDEFQNKYYKDNGDSLRLMHVINRYCEYKKICNELMVNKEYFTKDVEFDGGFKIEKLFKSGDQIPSGLPSSMQTIKTNIEKIRNVLVHVRESHENKVILPTPRNESLIKPYVFLLRRIAEEVAMRYDSSRY